MRSATGLCPVGTQKYYKYVLSAHLIPPLVNRVFPISRVKRFKFLFWQSFARVTLGRQFIISGAAEQSPGNGGGVELHRRQPRCERRDSQDGNTNWNGPILAPAQVWRLIIALPEPARSVAMLLVLTELRIGEHLAEQRRAVKEVEKLLVGPKWTQIGEVTTAKLVRD